MPNNLYEIIKIQSMRNPKKGALICDEEYSYQDLFLNVLYFANVLRLIYKIKSKDRVGIFLQNTPAYAISIFALNKIGAISVPINIRLDQETLRFILDDAGIKLVVVEESLRDSIEEASPGIETIIVEENRGYFSSKNIVADNAIEEEGNNKCIAKKDEVAIIMYTSGTTGTPKGAMMTNGNLLFNCRSCKGGFALHDDDIHLIAVPLFHVTGLNSQLLASVYMGNTAVLLKEYSTRDTIDLLQRHNVSIFIAVPSIFILLLTKFKKELTNLRALKKVGYAGAPMAVSTILSLKKCLPRLKLYNFYGLTETSSITTVLPDTYVLKTPDSVGMPLRGVRIKIVGDAGNELGVGEVGELLIQGGNVISGYLNNKHKTKETIVAGWLHSGDLARIDKQGRVFLVGRKKEIINRGGEKVYPIVLENKLFNHPKILEAAVVGIPDKILGEAVRICVVPKENVRLGESEVRKYCKQRFAEYELPRDVLFLKELPRNANGKIRKNILASL